MDNIETLFKVKSTKDIIAASKVMFKPGDVVSCNKLSGPKMIVESIVRPKIKIDFGERKSRIRGILCFWFSDKGEPFKKIFDTRDIEIIK